MNEEDYQITPHIRLPQGRIHIFAGAMSFFNKAEARTITKDFNNFPLNDGMLPQEFLNDISEPDEAGDFQAPLSCKIFLSEPVHYRLPFRAAAHELIINVRAQDE